MAGVFKYKIVKDYRNRCCDYCDGEPEIIAIKNIPDEIVCDLGFVTVCQTDKISEDIEIVDVLSSIKRKIREIDNNIKYHEKVKSEGKANVSTGDIINRLKQSKEFLENVCRS